MKVDTANKLMTGCVFVVVVVAISLWIVSLTGCSSLWQSFKSTAAPAAGGATGALVGSAAGPVGTVIGGGVGAALGDSIEENASFRAGETVGQGALDNEIARWKGEAVRATAKSGWFQKILMWGAGAAAAWLAWRNRHNFRERGFVKGMLHAVMGGNVGKE